MIPLRRRILLALGGVIPINLMSSRGSSEKITNTNTNTPDGVVRTQKLEIVDSRDTVRLRLGFTNDAERLEPYTFLHMMDKNNKMRLEFVVPPDNVEAEIRIKNSEERVINTLTAPQRPAIQKLPERGNKADSATDASIRNLQSQIDEVWGRLTEIIDRVNKVAE